MGRLLDFALLSHGTGVTRRSIRPRNQELVLLQTPAEPAPHPSVASDRPAATATIADVYLSFVEGNRPTKRKPNLYVLRPETRPSSNLVKEKHELDGAFLVFF